MAKSLGRQREPEAPLPADVRVDPAWFQAIYRHAAFGISLTSPEDTYLGVNPAYERMMGYSAAELVGRPLLAITHPNDREASDTLNAQMDRGEIDEFTLEKRYLCRDGSTLFGRLKVSRVDDENDRMLFKLAMVEDIGELKQRERDLEDSETRLLEAQRIANLGSWSIDMAEGEAPQVHWSRHLCQIHGIDEKDHPRRFEDYAEHVHPDDRPEFAREWMAAFEAREPFESAYHIVRPDGEVRNIHSHAIFLANKSDPGRLRCIGASIDVTERKQTEDSLLASEARLAEAQRVAQMGNWEYVLSSGIITWSDECYRIFGQKRETFVPSPESFFASVHPDDREKVKRVLTPEWRPRGSYSHEHRIIRPSGEIRHVQHQIAPFYDDEGALLRRVGVVQDITERKRAEEAALESQRQLQQSVDNIPALVSFIDKDRRYLFANRAYEDWYGIPTKDIVGRKIVDVLGPENAAKTSPYVAKVLEGERQDYTVSFDTIGGVRREVKGTFVPSIGADGAVRGFYVLVQDVTNEVAAEEALRRAKEVAEDASRAKSSFLATMSHELRTPLNAIIGFSEIISNEMLGPAGVPEYRGYAEDIRESGGLLLSIIGEILEFSKLESGKINLSEEVLEVHEVVGSALMLVAKSAEKRGLTVKSDLPEKLPRLRADRIKIMQTLGNLLSNAIKFTEDGGTVSVRAAVAAGGAFVIEVRDDGIGIAEQDIPRALLPFEQVDNSLSRNYSGTGLGLPLSRTFTELHGGTFELSSTPGKGTTVTLTFPIERIVSD